MSWVIEGVHEHEGYVAPIAKDGRDVFATRRDGLVMTRPSDAQDEVLPLSDGRAVLVCPRCCRLLPPCPLPSDYAIVKSSGDGWRCSSCGDVWDLEGQPSKAVRP